MKFFGKEGRGGFSLLELLIVAVIFVVAMGAFTTILIAFFRVDSRQSSVSEVSGQSQFVLQTLQSLIGQSSLVDMPADAGTNTLKLRMPGIAQDPTLVFASGTAIYIQVASGTAQALTSNKVSVSGLTFTKRSNPPGHDAVAIVFTMDYATQNLQQKFTQAFNTSVARVSAASFDSDVVPSSTGSPTSLHLGTFTNGWADINGAIQFLASGGVYNLGIGVAGSANAKLKVEGDIYPDAGFGLILHDPASGCWRLKVASSGVLSTVSSLCP